MRTSTRALFGVLVSALAATAAGSVSAAPLSAPTISTFAVPSPGPLVDPGGGGIAAGIDRGLWFVGGAATGARTIQRMSTTGALTSSYPLQIMGNGPIQECPGRPIAGPVSGPDGALWIACWDGDVLVFRVSTTGDVSRFVFGDDDSQDTVAGLVLGPDGALWLTAPRYHGILRFDLSTHTFTKFLVTSATPVGLSAGPGGALWFGAYDAASPCNEYVGRIDTTGQNLKTFRVGTNAVGTCKGPRSLTAGPDGQAWFIDSSNYPGSTPNSWVGAISADGQTVTPASASVTPASLSGLTTGTDGTLWYLKNDSAAPTLVNITTAGVVTENGEPVSSPTAMTVGPDGNLWFTGTNAIGQAVIAAPAAVNVTIDQTTVPNGTQGSAYGPVALTASGGAAPYTFAVTSGSVPPGVTLTPSGSLGGTPTAGGSFVFTVTATDINGGSGSQQYAVTVLALPAMTVSAIPNPKEYGQDLGLSVSIGPGATGTVTWSEGGSVIGSNIVGGGCAPTGSCSSGMSGINSGNVPALRTLSVGTHSITASYSGDPTYAMGTSAPYALVVTPVGTQMGVSAVSGCSWQGTTNASSAWTSLAWSCPSPQVVPSGSPLLVTADVVSLQASVAPEAASVSFADGSTVLGTASVTPAGYHSVATLTTAALAVGTHVISASYPGSATFAASSASVTVKVDAPPVVTVPANMTVEATGPGGAVVNFSASATDLEDGNVSVSCWPPSGRPFSLGTTTVTCSATDTAALTTSRSFTVTVQDTTAPQLSLPSDATVQSPFNTPTPVVFTVTAFDLVSGNVPVACDHASGSTFPYGSTTVTCSAADAAGNRATGSFRLTVADTTPPTITVPADMTVDPGTTGLTSTKTPVTYQASATDDSSVTMGCSPQSSDQWNVQTWFPIGTTTVICTARDAAGNTASKSFTITVNSPSSSASTVLTGIEFYLTLKGEAGPGEVAIASVSDPGIATPGSTPGLDKLRHAAEELKDALLPKWWIDGIRVTAKGERVFEDFHDATELLAQLRQDGTGPVPAATLSGWIGKLVRLDRVIAGVALEDASAARGDTEKLADARNELLRGDALAASRPTQAIERYKEAWKRAQEAVQKEGFDRGHVN